MSTPKRRRNEYEISESEQEDDFSDSGSVMRDRFNDPSLFLSKFGGYDSDEDEQDQASDDGTDPSSMIIRIFPLVHTLAWSSKTRQ
jgi:hypothetical protein